MGNVLSRIGEVARKIPVVENLIELNAEANSPEYVLGVEEFNIVLTRGGLHRLAAQRDMRIARGTAVIEQAREAAQHVGATAVEIKLGEQE